MWTLGVLQKQESEGEEALWLAGRERRPQLKREEAYPQTAESQGWTLQQPTREAVAGCAASSHPGLSST